MLLLFAKDKVSNIKVVRGKQISGFLCVKHDFQLPVANGAHHIIHID